MVCGSEGHASPRKEGAVGSRKELEKTTRCTGGLSSFQPLVSRHGFQELLGLGEKCTR